MFTSYFPVQPLTLSIFPLKKEEEEAKRRELERAQAEERARKEQEAQRIAQQQNNSVTHDIDMPTVIPSAPPLIGNYPTPPMSHQESFVSDHSAVGDNQREHSKPSDVGQTVQPPSFSSLYSVPTPRQAKFNLLY